MQALFFNLKSPKESFPGAIFGLKSSHNQIIMPHPLYHPHAIDLILIWDFWYLNMIFGINFYLKLPIESFLGVIFDIWWSSNLILKYWWYTHLLISDDIPTNTYRKCETSETLITILRFRAQGLFSLDYCGSVWRNNYYVFTVQTALRGQRGS